MEKTDALKSEISTAYRKWFDSTRPDLRDVWFNEAFEAGHDAGRDAIADEVGRLAQLNVSMRRALEDLVRSYVELVNSGDCGYWDPEEDSEVIAARKAIRISKGEDE